MVAKKPARTKTYKINQIAHVTNASVLKHTGKSWDEWIAILQRLNASIYSHKEIVALLKKKHKTLTVWWQHEVTTGYEVHIGRKLPGRNAKGLFSVTVTKTLPYSQKTVWKHLSSLDGISVWLEPISEFVLAPKNTYEVRGGIFGEVRTLKAPLRVRMTWQDNEWEKPTFLQVYVITQPKKKSMLIFNQEGLTTAVIKDQLRARWKQATERFIEFLNTQEKTND